MSLRSIVWAAGIVCFASAVSGCGGIATPGGGGSTSTASGTGTTTGSNGTTSGTTTTTTATSGGGTVCGGLVGAQCGAGEFCQLPDGQCATPDV